MGLSPQVRGYLCLVGTREFRDLLVDRLPKDWNPRPSKGNPKALATRLQALIHKEIVKLFYLMVIDADGVSFIIGRYPEAKRELRKLKYFTMQKCSLQKIL